MSISFLFAALVASTATDRDPDILFAKWKTFDARLDTVEIWLEGNWKGGERLPPHYLLRRTISYRPELKLKGQTIFWADQASCVKGSDVITDLAKINMPPIYVPGVSPEEATTVRADGAAYRLVVPGQYPSEPGRVALTFGTQTPVANWVDASFRALASCWQTKRP
jgi:hypothetical protein